ncbi:glycosyltransferase family 4 protein [Halapricum hydrolyticum]|uniref:Glycosyltransferase family 4 protein n=1 Tax=Halapricum hydrolyticum TaxID=2979991 RepID=A0AAE3LKH6_9EURY|nr:glycosyltransferase family 4 protein [Halapricum hydrolyticum]MCU4719362.1 glycosyltransferase family 4 protein [Halapricum hydrolyticum]MCU4728373.1 glycosyltransferase family 4 protein [Halapricum hydrolyticum]
MRVAFVSMETTHHDERPGTRRFERLARLLAERGHDVTVFCARTWDGERETATDAGVIYRGVTDAPAPTSFALRLPWALARFDPDVIHALPTPASQVVAANVGGTLSRAPLVVEFFGDTDPSESRWAGRALSVPDRIVTPSEMVRTELREHGVADDRLLTLPESIDMELVRSVEPTNDVDVAFAHPLDETANVKSLLLGLAELRDRDWSATIIGDGPAREEYEQEVEDLRIGDRVEFVGECSREERLSIYRGAHAFVQTAYREQFATELLWALAAGCVGIVEYQAESSAHELIENYDRGYRVTTPQQLADAIVDAGEFEHLTVDDSWAEYDHGTVLESYLQLYRDLQDEYGVL